MYVAHYLGECRLGTYITTICTNVTSYYNRQYPSKIYIWSEPRTYCTGHTWKRYGDKTSADSNLHLHMCELFFLGDVYK